MAPDATLLALKIVGPDLSDQTAGSTGPIPESGSANVMLIAPAIRYAVEKAAGDSEIEKLHAKIG